MKRGEVLLTVDFEDGCPAPTSTGDSYLPRLTDRILDFLAARRALATFFVVGTVVERFPQLIERVAAAGHEVAWHTHHHRRLEALGPARLARDIEHGRKLLAAVGIDDLHGFRAPFFSLTRQTDWAWQVLREQGLLYDASLVPVWNPVAGHPGPFRFVRRLHNGLWSVPIPVWRVGPGLGLPVGGGTYLRLLPRALHRRVFAHYHALGEPTGIFFHPYDIEPGVPTGAVFGHNVLFNAALRLNRRSTLSRIAELIAGQKTSRVIDYVQRRHQVTEGPFAS